MKQLTFLGKWKKFVEKDLAIGSENLLIEKDWRHIFYIELFDKIPYFIGEFEKIKQVT